MLLSMGQKKDSVETQVHLSQATRSDGHRVCRLPAWKTAFRNLGVCPMSGVARAHVFCQHRAWVLGKNQNSRRFRHVHTQDSARIGVTFPREFKAVKSVLGSPSQGRSQTLCLCRPDTPRYGERSGQLSWEHRLPALLRTRRQSEFL